MRSARRFYLLDEVPDRSRFFTAFAAVGLFGILVYGQHGARDAKKEQVIY
jgi:hypothetical protein